MQGFASATRALATVTAQEQVVPRPNGVASNLTAVGKDAIRYMSSAVDQDLRRKQPEINAAPTEREKKRVIKNAMRERAKRLKRFNVFNEDPSMIGEDNEGDGGNQMDCINQANYYLNQPAEKRRALLE